MDFLRPYDAPEARRSLRARMVGLARQRGFDPADVPHSFEAAALLDRADRLLTAHDPASGETCTGFLADAGRAFGLSGRDDRSRECFERGLREASSDGDRFHFHYLLGRQYHSRRGQWRDARDSFQAAIGLNPVASVSRARAFLGLLVSSCEMGEHAEAVRAGRSALGMNIREVEPHVRFGLATAYWRSGDLPKAEQETLAASHLYEEQGDEVGRMLVTAHLGEMYLAEGDARRALSLLGKARETQMMLLDVSRLGETCRLKARAHRRLGQLDEAVTLLCEALRYHAEAGRHGAYVTALRDLATCLDLRGEPETALALHVQAMREAERVSDSAEAFRSVTAALKLIADRRTHLDAVPHLVFQGQSVLHGAVDRLAKLEVADFVGVTAALSGIGADMPRGEAASLPPGFPHPGAADEGRQLVSRVTSPTLRQTLHERVAEGLRIRRAPSTDHVVGFLTGWFGGWFRNADYQAEFLLTQETSKYHLRELRNLDIIRQIGTRKAARYQLGFHLPVA